MNYIEKLEKLLINSYSPYSNYKVSAIVVMKDGKEFNGVNIENASYTPTICAERSAISAAISAGYKPGDFKSLYVMTESKTGTPCGVCRQVMDEFFDDKTIIYVAQKDDTFKEYKIKELLPDSFGKEDLA